jgi:hypothetical protein
MRIFLRLVAVLCALSVVWTLLFLVQFSRGISALLATGTFGVVTLIGWLITFIAGPIAAVQLFRLKPSGRIAAIVLFGSMLAYYLTGLVAFRQPGTATGPILVLAALLVALLTMVASPAAKRACER